MSAGNTQKSLGAALTGTWCMRPEWIAESARQGFWVEESAFGRRYHERPFEGKSFVLTALFCAAKSSVRLELGQKLILVRRVTHNSR
jgi:hypothetical protein